jgi:tripartite-type tricarboxylate transporter receptor subunit TctC
VQDAGAANILLTAAFYTEAQGLVASGHLRPLAVFSDQRFARLPEVPTFEELGYPKMRLSSFNGFYFAARTPAFIVRRFNDAARWSMQQPELTQPIQAIGSRNLDFTAQEFSDYFRNEYATWTRRSHELGIQVEH